MIVTIMSRDLRITQHLVLRSWAPENMRHWNNGGIMLGQRWRLVVTIDRYLHNICTILAQLCRHLADISPAPDKYYHLSEQVVYSCYLYKAVETRCELRYIKTAIAHTTQYQCCVNIKKTRPRQRDVLSTETLQGRANVHDIGPRINQQVRRITTWYNSRLLFKQRWLQ